MAENNAAAKKEEAPEAAPTAERKVVHEGQKPTLLMAVVALNMAAMIGVVVVLWKAHKAEKDKPRIEDAEQGLQEDEAHKKQQAEKGDYLGKIVPMETFLVNLAGTRGNKLVKINMELEVDGTKVEEEIERRKPQIRDMIIILLSSKTYDQMTTKEGKEALRNEVRETVNGFLSKGKIKAVYFTDFIVN